MPDSKMFVSIGELMVECIVDDELPDPNRTSVVPLRDRPLGGAGYNLYWHLSGFGRTVRLAAPVSKRDFKQLSDQMRSATPDTSGIMSVQGSSDLLVTIASRDSHRSLYLLGNLPQDLQEQLLESCDGADVIALNGGRHPAMRDAYSNLVGKSEAEILAFNPSYAIYEYAPSELQQILRYCDICLVNEREYECLCEAVGSATVAGLFGSGSRTLLVTRGREGVKALAGGKEVNLPSLVDRPGVFFGAGDALLAGYLHEFCRTRSLAKALRFGLAVAAEIVDSGQVRIDIQEEVARQRLPDRQ